MQAVLTVAFPFFAVIVAGFCCGRTGVMTQSDSAALNRFVFRIAMPVALFALTSRTESISPSDLVYALCYLISALIIIFAAYYSARSWFRLPRPDAGVHAFGATLGNAVFLGLPIAQSIPGWGPPFVILMLMEGIVIITIGSILIAGRVDEQATDLRTGLREILTRPFQNPLVVGSAGGFLFSLTGLNFAEPVTRFLAILGSAAGPTALFSLGLFLAFAPLQQHQIASPRIAHIVALKMILLPILTYGLMSIADTVDQLWGVLTRMTFAIVLLKPLRRRG